jgi:Caspase domain
MWLLLSAVLLAAPPAELRLAVVVGSNTAVEGRSPLRYAHADAQSLAEVLRETGHFEKDDIAVLLDPSPGAVLQAVRAAAERARQAKQPTLFVFYYSGHADEHALYPQGQPLELSGLKVALEDPAFEVRVGIIDSCRGGGWTQAKGLRPIAPFEVGQPALASEGTALLAASSGQEDAHEAEALKGSFFTHHLVAGLRGAADQSGDGRVTLSEAFAYTNRLTIRDSATRSSQPQHPSFDLRVRGRQELVLADLASNETTLTVDQKEGPLQLVQLSSGVVVVEASPGAQLVRVALPPGAYLVRRVTDTGVRSREVKLVAGQAAVVDEASLTVVGEQVASKGLEVEPRHLVGLTGGVLPETWQTGVAIEALYRWRFSSRFAVRARALYSFPVDTSVAEQLERDFGVLPSSFSSTRFMVGADLEWLAWASARGLSVGVRAGASLVGRIVGFATAPSSPPTLGPAGTMGLSLALQLPPVPRLSVMLDGAVHVGFSSAVWVAPQVTLGVAWHF